MSEYPPGSNIPESLQWKPDAEFMRVAAEIRALREGEKRGAAISKRTKAVLELLEPQGFIERYAAKGAPLRLFPDANGLRLDVGLENAEGVHSHIPYELMTEEAADTAAALMDDGLSADMTVRIAEAKKKPEAADLGARQRERFLRIAKTPDVDTFIRGFTGKYATFGDANPYQEGERLPSLAYAEALGQGTGSVQDRLMRIAKLASRLNEGEEDEHDPLVGKYRSAHLMDSKGLPRFTRAAYEKRAQALNDEPMNAEAAKALTALFSRYGYEELRQAGVEAVRGLFAGGQEFVAFYTSEQYARVLVEPKKHIRGDAYKNYLTLPAIKNADFEAFEGFMVPYFHLKEAAQSAADVTQEEAPTTGRQLNSVLSFLSADLPPEDFESIVAPGRAYADALEKRQLNGEAQRLFMERVTEILARYGERVALPAAEMLDRYMKVPERVPTRFDQAFEDEAPTPEMKERIAAYRRSLPVENPSITVIRSGSESHIPFAFEGKALRALAIEARPTLIPITGAKFENVDDQGRIDAIADAIVEVMEEAAGNTFPPGTLSGRIAETIVRRHWKERAKEDGARSRMISIEPGKSTYAGPQGYPDEDLKRHEPFALLPTDAILTPYIAGWSPGGEEHPYRAHVMLRQSIIRRASDGQPRAALLVNGGGWSIAECVEIMRDRFPLIVVPESGRLAAFVAHLNRTRSTWTKAPYGDRAQAGIRIIEEFIAAQPEAEHERLTQDLVKMKERGLSELIMLMAEGAQIVESSTEDLKGTLRQFFAPKG